ncbi:MAG: hypothetical protein ISS61_04560 [Desulfobacteraceae bacterium]|nr:hypothetical protein [Desulfobacteraceae bacterium]
MGGTALRECRLLIWPLVGVYLLLGGGCDKSRSLSPVEEKALPIINKVVVAGFKAARSTGEKPGVVHDPLTGAVFAAEPVSASVVQEMNESLFQNLVAQERYQLISPNQAKGVLSGIAGLDASMEKRPIEILQKVGKRFGADAVLGGYIYRWRQREGGDYAVKRPASVAFGLHLIRPGNGATIWKGRFDKTQRSLSENIFDFQTFIEGQGRWMTADKLATLGLQKLVKEMSSAIRESAR